MTQRGRRVHRGKDLTARRLDVSFEAFDGAMRGAVAFFLRLQRIGRELTLFGRPCRCGAAIVELETRRLPPNIESRQLSLQPGRGIDESLHLLLVEGHLLLQTTDRELARMGVVTARMLLKYSKYAVLVIFIVAAVVSPGTDMMSQLIMAIPMLGLYAISIVIAAIFGKRTLRENA